MISMRSLVRFILLISKISEITNVKVSSDVNNNMIDKMEPRADVSVENSSKLNDQATASSILKKDIVMKHEPKLKVIPPSHHQNNPRLKPKKAQHLAKGFHKPSKNFTCETSKCQETMKKLAGLAHKNNHFVYQDARRKKLAKGVLSQLQPTSNKHKKPQTVNKKPKRPKVTYCPYMVTTTSLPRTKPPKKITIPPTTTTTLSSTSTTRRPLLDQPNNRLSLPKVFQNKPLGIHSTAYIHPTKSKEIHNKTISKVKQVSKLKEIVKKYEPLFRGLGCEHGKCHLTINENSNYDNVPSKITVALKNDLKQELDDMEESGIIMKDTAPTSWVVYLPQTKNVSGDANEIAAKIIHGDADENILDSLRSEHSDVLIAKAPFEKTVTSEVSADEAVDGGDLPMYEMESFYRDISLNDHLSWVRPQPITYLNYTKPTEKIVKTTTKMARKTTLLPTTEKERLSLQELTISRIRSIVNSIKSSSTTQRSETKKSFLFFHSKKQRH